jgi:hypothetical protein
MNAHQFDSDWDYYDQYENEKSAKEAQDEYDADFYEPEPEVWFD